MRNKLAAVSMNVSEILKSDVVDLAAKMNRSQTNIFENCFYSTKRDGILNCGTCGNPLCFKIEIDYLKKTKSAIKCSSCQNLTTL